jgi:hypothetical protein
LSKDPVPFVNRYAYVGGNPVRFVDPTGECRVEVPSKKLPFSVTVHTLFGEVELYRPSHLYLVSYDPSGKTLAYRGGPSRGITGHIFVHRGPWRKGFPDWENQESHSVRTVVDNKESCAAIWDKFDEVRDAVHNQRTYSFLQRNSNSLIRALLAHADLPERKPGGHHPGWSNDLGY